MSNEIVNEVKKVLRKEYTEAEFYFSSSVFYYLAGYFPNMKISNCAYIISEIRNEIIAGTFFE